jgi:ADP-ribosylglycohydrolase
MNLSPIQRAQQALCGLAVGDAFGETLFGEPKAIARRVAKRLISTARPWRWTDDTAMALSVVDVLAQCQTIEQDQLMASFVERWAAEPNRGYGQGAFTVLTRVSYGAPWRREAQRLFNGQGSFGNGAAMRAAPIGAFFADDFPRVQAEAIRSAETTHMHADGIAGAVAVAIAAACATRGMANTALLSEVLRWTPPGHVHQRLQRAAEIPIDAQLANVADELGTGLDVAAHDTVPFCLWVAARHWHCYEDALWTAAGQPGDRDTLAAIVGGIVVMVPGTEIPVLWQAATEQLPAFATG